MDEKIVALYCLCDDFLKARRHHEDPQCRMSDAEVMTVALVAMQDFGSNLRKAMSMVHAPRYIPRMLSESRLCRRMHALTPRFEALFRELVETFQRANASDESTDPYLVDSFPVRVCRNSRIRRCRLYPSRWRPPSLHEAWLAENFGEAPPPGQPAASVPYLGWSASENADFYGVRVHLMTTVHGQPVECVIAPGAIPDVSRLPSFSFDLPQGSRVLGDKGYNDYREEDFLETAAIHLCPTRRKNSRRPVDGCRAYSDGQARKRIETAFSVLEQAFPRTIHAVTPQGFQLKVFLFVVAYCPRLFHE